MFALPRNRLLLLVAALLAVIGSARAADAGWVTIKNDTKGVIVVQTAVTVNGQAKRGKPVRLLPGETSREFVQPQALTVEVYDAQNPNKPIATSNLTIKAENHSFTVGAGPGGVVVVPAPMK